MTMAASGVNNKKILVVDDDRMTVELISTYLRHDGYTVLAAREGGAALEMARQHHPDLIILDLMLPTIHGLDIARLLRADSNIPIIMLSARSTEDDVLSGLDVGADDYMTKPFSPRELVARVRTVLRRMSFDGRDSDETPPEELHFGALRINTASHQVFVNEESINLTPREFKLLETMARTPGRVYTRTELLDRVSGLENESLERAVDFHIMNLRRKIDKHVQPNRQPNAVPPASNDAASLAAQIPTFIETVFGVGYRFNG